MNIVRAYKLMKLGIEPDPLCQKIISFIDSKFEKYKKLKIFETDYPDRISYFNKKNECMFQLTNKNILYVRGDDLWYDLNNKYKLLASESKEILKFWFHKKLNLKINGIELLLPHQIYRIEDDYKKYLNEHSQSI